MYKRYLLIVFVLLTGIFAQAQYDSKYFVYLQTEPAQPFYIKINNQNISANSSGYLILPQLKDGNYKLVVGFPQNKYPEQAFNFKIDSKDKGYLIKNFGEEGWGLFDLQTMAVEKPILAVNADVAAVSAPKPETVPKEDVSDFTKVLSKAANDPSLLEKPKPEPAPPVVVEKPVEEKPVVKEAETAKAEVPAPVTNTQPSKEAETVSSAPQDAIVPATAPPAPAVTQKEVAPRRDVTKIMQNESETGVTIVYEEKTESGAIEPVTIFIPEPRKAAEVIITAPAQKPAIELPAATKPVVAEEKKPEPLQQPVQQTSPPPVKEEPRQEAAPAPVQAAPAAVEQPVAKDASAQEPGKLANIQSKIKNIFRVQEKPAVQENTGAEHDAVAEKARPGGNCIKVADENDFLKLRRTMAQKDNDDQMIGQARTAFRSKCYTTAQIKYLSSMFLSNAGKYNFYEAAYAHVADPEQFSTLLSELKDQYYRDKFNALTGK